MFHNSEILAQLFSYHTPFGPAATGADPEYTYSDIYYPTECFEKAVHKRHNVVFGRRGAGKSSLIQRILKGNEYDIKLVLHKDILIEELKKLIPKGDCGTIFCETISRLWAKLFWVAIFKHAVASAEDIMSVRKIREYLHLSDEDYKLTVTQCVGSWISKQTESKDVKTGFVASVIQGIIGQNQSSFNDAKQQAIEWLRGNSVIIILDSQERYFLDEDIEKRLIGGLLKALAEWQSERFRLYAKCFFPSELYYRIKESSENEAKDFEHAIVLKWNSKDIFTLLIKRLLVFEALHGISDELKRFEDAAHRDLMDLCRSVWGRRFPQTITNSVFNFEEHSIAYVMRHCQLLPRQVITLGNKVAENHRWVRPEPHEYRFSAPEVKSGVRTAEQQMCGEIFSSFSIPYPKASQVIQRHLRQFRARCGLSMIYEVKGRSNEREFPEYKENPMHFERLLIELGIVGKRCEDCDTERYFRAEYEYYLPDQLHISDYDDRLIHPIVLETFGVQVSPSNCPKAVYPRGADLEEYAPF